MLYGSSVLPATFTIKGEFYTLGDVVRLALKRSGLTPEQWNDLPMLEREYRLVRALYKLHGIQG